MRQFLGSTQTYTSKLELIKQMIELINGFGNLHKQIVGIKLKFTIRVGMRKKNCMRLRFTLRVHAIED